MKSTEQSKTYFKCAFFLLFALMAVTKVSAQAFDGDSDYKILVGYTDVGGRSGLEGGVDMGINDYLSYGAKITYITSGKKTSSDRPTSIDRTDLAAMLNLHFSELFSMNQRSDLYIGCSAGWRAVGLNAGFRYNFSEICGVYIQMQQNLWNSIASIAHDNGDPCLYRKKTSLSVGFTFNIE